MQFKISQFKDSIKSFPVSKWVKAVALKDFALCKGWIFGTRCQYMNSQEFHNMLFHISSTK